MPQLHRPGRKVGWKEQFRSVAGADTAGDGRFAVAAQVDQGAVLNVYTAEGKKEISVKLQGVPKGLDAVSGMVSVYTDDIVYFYNDRGINTCIYNAGEKYSRCTFFNKNRQQ